MPRLNWQRPLRSVMAAMLLASLTSQVFAAPVAMPNAHLTPGAVRPGMTAAQLCAKSFHTGSVRNVPESVKRQVFLNYRTTPRKGICCEVDHLISLELGGSNDIANLWPEPYEPTPGARQKDIVENWLHRQVCAGKIPLATAQHDIAIDWYAIYQTMTISQQKTAVRAR